MFKNIEIKIIILALVLIFFAMVFAWAFGRQTMKTSNTENCNRYISKGVYECQLIDFRCDSDENVFTDRTGCGCRKTECELDS